MKRAVVIGSGPNGLTAARVLARAGLEVVVHEAADELGGGCRTTELTLPGFRHDVCSAIHPLAAVSPAFRELGLELDWVEPPVEVAHPFDDGTAAAVVRSPEETAAGLGPDGPAYLELLGPYLRAWPALAALRRPRLGPRALLAGLASAHALAGSRFQTERARALFAGAAAHSMLPLERRPSGGFGIALLLLAHVAGWPFPRGGASAIAAALAAGLEVHTGSPVDELPRADVVVADVMPRELVRIARGQLPARYESALGRYRHGPGAFKLDWALAGPIPWSAEECRRAGTVHLGGTLAEIAASESRPGGDRPFVLLAQQSLFDPTRAPEGKHAAWAYCHVPNGSAVDLTDTIEAQVERFAPGFRELILARSALGPAALEAHNRNLVGGDLNGGLMDLRQLYFRPVRRLNPYRTPLRGVYLCSSATPPGGGVHGLCGYWAAKAALRDLST
ncbi:MAG: NAD(P)/FAD-dependent oxidoreductase [Gaiellaceae bacterium]